MERNPILKSHLLLTLLLVFIIIACFSPPATSESKEAVGYGYKIRSATVDSFGRLLTADLELINKSTVFEPDIQNLTLTAR